jgi:glycosyltransferase involved in cell wall biosynthesis
MNHVALVIPGIDRIAGAERQMLLLAHGLHRRGWRVTVVALSGTGGHPAAELTEAGIPFMSLRMRKGLADPRGWVRFHSWLLRDRPDVVHAHLPHAAWFARWSRLAAPVRVLVDTLHSTATGTPGRRIGFRLSNWLPDKVTAVSHGVAEVHRAAGMVSDDKLVVLPNGVDAGQWRPDETVRNTVRKRLGLENDFLWFAAGRLEPVKDYPTLLRAMVGLPQPSLLVIAGAGPLESELRRLAKELGLERRVRFLGFEPDVRQWMQAADAFVQSSLWEGLPMGLLEAAACALPAVATDVAGTRAALVDGQTGFLAAAASPLALHQAMTRMMQLPQEDRRAIGDQARRHVTERFSLDAVLDSWEALYADLLTRKPAPSRWAQSRI